MIQPLGNNIIVKPTSVNELESVGLKTPKNVNDDKPRQGEVIAVGPGRMVDGEGKTVKLLPMALKVKDNVLFRAHVASEIEYEDETYLVLSEADILALIK